MSALRPRLLPVTLLISLALDGCGNGDRLDLRDRDASSSGTANCREPAVAGAFYPADSASLCLMVDRFLEAAPSSGDGSPDHSGIIISGIVPHAGYVYSGETAGDFFALLGRERPSVETVVVVSAAHSVPFRGISVSEADCYRTPLGPVPVDRALAARILASHPAAGFDPAYHSGDHTIEVQLPFLQRCLSDSFSIVPILLGQTSRDDLCLLAELLAAERTSGDIIVIASSDLSHYPPESTADHVDSCTIAAFMNGDPETFLEEVSRLESYGFPGLVTCACGSRAIFVILTYNRLAGPVSPVLLHTATSADAGGDPSGVVGYAAAAFRLESSGHTPPDTLSALEKEWLCGLARAVLEASAAGESIDLPDPPSDRLLTPAGAFVTYRSDGNLRGCIGTLRATMPLHETVYEMARAAALEDPRFPPISTSELASIALEISVLTPMQLVPSPDSVRVGIDGLYITDGRRAAVLLPQVSLEFGWSRTDFLEQVCVKAGLPLDAYLDPSVALYRFRAEVFQSPSGST